jgi:16S rRNA (cytosine967-C5)-methyltransferase
LIPGYAARRAALLSLLEFEHEDRPVAETLSFDRELDPRDHALALQIASTTVRWKALLDHHLAPFLRTRTTPDLLWILRLSVAQAHLLKRIPIHSAVDLGVELAREAGGTKAAGFANAVLRRAAHNPVQRPQGEDAASLSIRHSHPEWLVERWLSRHGPEATVSMLKAGNADPALWVRVRPGTADLPWTPEQVLESAHSGLFVRPDLPRDQVLACAAFRRGDLALQDPASGAVALELAPHLRPGAILVDLCSAPGGKICCLRDAGMLGGVRTVALDNSGFRQRRTRNGFWLRSIPALVGIADGLHPPLRPRSVDIVLLDAPCSNLGVLSRRPEARWRAQPVDPARHGELQRRLLDSALDIAKPGGVVLYSVCSTEPEECDEVAQALEGRAEILSRSLRLPGQGGWDGFFSVLARVDDSSKA